MRSPKDEEEIMKLLLKKHQPVIELHYPLSAERVITRQGHQNRRRLNCNLIFSPVAHVALILQVEKLDSLFIPSKTAVFGAITYYSLTLTFLLHILLWATVTSAGVHHSHMPDNNVRHI